MMTVPVYAVFQELYEDIRCKKPSEAWKVLKEVEAVCNVLRTPKAKLASVGSICFSALSYNK